MRVLLVHNYYRFRGGEDSVFETSREALEANGIEVDVFATRSSDEVARRGQLGVLRNAVFGRDSAERFLAHVRSLDPDVVHFHNTFPTMSPSFIRLVRLAGFPTVVTLHNYRYACLNGLQFRHGRTCSACVGRRLALPGVWHACYRGRRTASVGAAAIHASHRLRGTWTGGADRYIVPSAFAAARAIEGGVPEARLEVVPNTVFPVPGAGTGAGGYAAYAGRLSSEKGLWTLIEAWRGLQPGIPLRVAGTGPLEDELRASLDRTADSDIELVGSLSRAGVLRFFADARLVIVPSESPETFGLVALEALSVGTPVLVSRTGALPELVRDERAGATFETGDPASLAAAAGRLLTDEVSDALRRSAARAVFESRFAPEVHASKLAGLYEDLRVRSDAEDPLAKRG